MNTGAVELYIIENAIAIIIRKINAILPIIENPIIEKIITPKDIIIGLNHI